MVGGGTAGHVSPLLSVATELERGLKDTGDSADIRLITDRAKVAQMVLASTEAYPRHRVLSGKLRRYHGQSWLARLVDVKTWALNLRDLVFMAIGLVQAVVLALVHRPDIVFINGGSIGWPVALGARLIRCPYVVHESDTVLGLANRLIVRRAAQVAAAFDVKLDKLSADKTVVTGIPLRPEFTGGKLSAAGRRELARELGLNPDLPVVVAVGGSQGAQRLNNWLMSQAGALLDSTQLLMVSGPAHYQALTRAKQQLAGRLGRRLVVLGFTDAMADLMRLADVVVSRAGATTLAELAAIGRPAIIVPNAQLTGGHQLSNAQWFSARNMVEVVTEDELKRRPEQLAAAILKLLADKTRRRRLAGNIKEASAPESAAKVAQLLISAATARRARS